MTHAIGHEPRDDHAEEWWTDLDAEILDCLAVGRPLSPAEVGEKVGISEAGASSCLALLAHEGKVRIRLVELPSERTA